MSKNKKNTSKNNNIVSNDSEKMGHAVNLPATDNQKVNQEHNINKASLGPNTKR